MDEANRGDWKACARGHQNRDAGSCETSWSGRANRRIRERSAIPGLALSVAFMLAPSAMAQPIPVNPNVLFACGGGQFAPPEVQIRQDRCFTWSEPAIARDGNTFRVTQSATPIQQCSNTGAENRYFYLPQLAVGTYRLEYAATPAGTFPPHVREFAVRPCGPRTLATSPFQPLAMEPVQVSFWVSDGCEYVAGVRPEAGGFAILLDGDLSNPGVCDAIATAEVTLGTLPPGHYFVRLVQQAQGGGSEDSTLEFDVAPATSAALRYQLPDYSGIWTSPDEEPYTAFDFINSFDRIGPGQARNGLSGTWYFYDATGRPTWYFIEANNSTQSFARTFNGGVFEYRAANPAAPAFQRTIAGTRVGDFRIDFGLLDSLTRVIVTIGGVTREFRVQRFRWQRAAWPPAQ